MFGSGTELDGNRQIDADIFDNVRPISCLFTIYSHICNELFDIRALMGPETQQMHRNRRIPAVGMTGLLRRPHLAMAPPWPRALVAAWEGRRASYPQSTKPP